MKIQSLVCSLALAAVVLTQAYADTVKMGIGPVGNYKFDPQGSIGVDLSNYVLGKSTDGTWYGTFCIQKNEYFTPGSIYNVVVNDRAISYGVDNHDAAAKAAGYDKISKGTAYLYTEFVKGTLNTTLSGFNYTSSSSLADLQNWFWYLEDEMTTPGSNAVKTLLINVFGTLTNAKADYTGTAVKVLNLTSNHGCTVNQNQLVYVGVPVPDGGMTFALLGLSLLGLALGKRRA